MRGRRLALPGLAVVVLVAAACGDTRGPQTISQVGEDGRVETRIVEGTSDDESDEPAEELEEKSVEELVGDDDQGAESDSGEVTQQSVTGEGGSVFTARAEGDLSVTESVDDAGSATYAIDAGSATIEITYTVPILEPGVVPWVLPMLTASGETLPLQGLALDIGPDSVTLAGIAPSSGTVEFVPLGWFIHPVDLWVLPGGLPFAFTAALDPAAVSANLGVPTDASTVPGGQGIEVFGRTTGGPDDPLRVSLFVDDIRGQRFDPFGVAVGFRFDDLDPARSNEFSFLNSRGLFCTGPTAAAPDDWGMYRCAGEGKPELGPVTVTAGQGRISFTAADFDPVTFSSVDLLFGPPNPDPRAILSTSFFDGDPTSSIFYFETGDSIPADAAFNGADTWTLDCADLDPLLGDGRSTRFFFGLSAYGNDPEASAEGGHAYLDLASASGEALGC